MRVATDKCPCGCGQRSIMLDSRPLYLRAFVEDGDWFVYMRIGKHWRRWSSIGYMAWRETREEVSP